MAAFSLLLSPWFWLAVALYTVSIAGGAYLKGESHVQAKWDEDKAARMAHLSEIVVGNLEESNKASTAAKDKERVAKDAFDKLAQRNAALSKQLDAAHVDAVIVERLRDAVATANAQAGAAPGIPPSAPAAATTGSKLVAWGDAVTDLYRQCKDEVVGFQTWFDNLKW